MKPGVNVACDRLTRTSRSNGTHHTLYSEIIGIDRVLRLIRLEKDALVVRTEFADQPETQQEWTFRRIE